MNRGPRAEISLSIRYNPDNTGEHGISSEGLETLIDTVYYTPVTGKEDAIEDAIMRLEELL